MIWLGWRQQRAETVIAAAILAAVAVWLIPTGIHMAAAYDADGLGACLHRGASGSCGPAISSFESRFGQVSNFSAWVTLLPGVIGILLAAPFIGALEHGTYRLDWTQSIPRGRWIAGKLAIAVATALLASLVLVVLVTWWRAPLVHIRGRMSNSVYDGEGIVSFGYTLFALGLALAIGVLWRRAVPALISALAAYLAARVFVDTWLRQRLLPADTVVWNVRGRVPNLDRAWVLSQHVTDRLGRPITAIGCPHNGGGACRPVELRTGFIHAVYQPASHFWALQGAETAIFTAAAVALLGLAAWWTQRRVA